MSKRKLYRILIEAVVVALFIAALVFFVGFRVTKVQIEGNQYYTDEEIKKMVLDAPNAGNSILVMLTKTEEKTKDAQMIDHVTIKRKNRNTIVVNVKEKQMVGCLEFQGQYVNFDRQGVIQIITDEQMAGVPLIDGLSVKSVKVGQKLKGINSKKLNTILSVGKMLEKSEQKPDRLVFNDMNQLVLYYGEVEIRLGSDENMDEKMNRLSGILPQLEGMEGILHLENITEDTAGVVFDKASEAEDGEEEQDGENSDTSSQTETTTPPAGILPQNETPDRDEVQSQNEDAQDEEEFDDSQLEYSDGTDSAESEAGANTEE
ncbi:MAG: FtsQ-type POTRA domain-containing protein [Firmicutes bacterium]|nr:FtsQ-type POTRA domain-containing protein [Bacillota bacterium]